MAEPIIVTPGQVIPQPDWEALARQHGGSKSHQVRPPTRAELDSDEDYDQNPIYRYYFADGSYVEARKAPNGDYQVVDYHPSETFRSQQRQATSPSNRRTKTDIEGTPDPSKADGYDNERPRMVTRDAETGQELESRPLTAAEYKEWNERRQRSRNPDGRTDAEIAAEEEKRKAEEARRPTPTAGLEPVYGPDGKPIGLRDPKTGQMISTPVRGQQSRLIEREDGTYAVSVDDDGNVTVKKVEGLPPQPRGGSPQSGLVPEYLDPRNPQRQTHWFDPRTGQRIPVVNGPARPLPPQYQDWRPDPTKPGFGLFERQQQLLKAVAAGEIDPEDAKAQLELDQANALAVQKQEADLVNQQRGVWNDLSQQGIQRGNLANAAAGQANSFASRIEYADPGLGSAFLPALAAVMDAIGSVGGFTQQPMPPAVAAMYGRQPYQPLPMVQGLPTGAPSFGPPAPAEAPTPTPAPGPVFQPQPLPSIVPTAPAPSSPAFQPPALPSIVPTAPASGEHALTMAGPGRPLPAVLPMVATALPGAAQSAFDPDRRGPSTYDGRPPAGQRMLRNPNQLYDPTPVKEGLLAAGLDPAVIAEVFG